MKKITLELTNEEYKALERMAKQILAVMNPIETKPKKWIHKDGYLINTKTGVVLDKITKKRVPNIHADDMF